MNATTRNLDPVVATQTTRNLALARRMLEEVLGDDSLLDPIPDGAALILLPYDDPVLGVLNLGLATKRVLAGEVVHLHRIGVPRSDASGQERFRELEAPVAHLRPRWPRAAADEAATPAYDPSRDLLVIDFFGGERQADGVLFMNPYVGMMVDPLANEVVGLLVPSFVGVVRKQQELMGELLLLSFAPIEGLTREEAIRRRDEIGYGDKPAHSVPPAIDLWNLQRLIA